MVRNPKMIKWTPPTTRVNGQPIEVPLNFEVGFRIGANEIQPLFAVVGNLQENGVYTAPMQETNLPRHTEILISIRAIDNQQDDIADNDLFSAWSDEISVVLEEDSEPKAPLDFSAE
jgi:hypothetical protein